jgi:hypothetical protein
MEEWERWGSGWRVGEVEVLVEERADESVVWSERRREPVRQPNLEPLEHTI